MEDFVYIYAIALLIVFISIIVFGVVATKRNKAKRTHPIIIDESADEFD